MIKTNSIEKIIMTRRSTRCFTSKPIPRFLLEHILTLGTWAPCPHGYQPWRFIVLKNGSQCKLRIISMLESNNNNLPIGFRTLLRGNIEILKSAKVVIVILSDCSLEKKGRNIRGDFQEMFRLFETQSTAAVIQNILLSAHSRKIDTVWLGLPVLFEKQILALLDEKTSRFMAMVALGYAGSNQLYNVGNRQRIAVRKKLRYV